MVLSVMVSWSGQPEFAIAVEIDPWEGDQVELPDVLTGRFVGTLTSEIPHNFQLRFRSNLLLFNGVTTVKDNGFRLTEHERQP
jgi:hypothetical protein